APPAEPPGQHGAGGIPVGPRRQAGFQPISANLAERGTSVTASLTVTVSPGARLRLGGRTSQLNTIRSRASRSTIRIGGTSCASPPVLVIVPLAPKYSVPLGRRRHSCWSAGK